MFTMENLIRTIKQVLKEKEQLPFSVYSSFKEQRILNVPILKPLLIFVLDGEKKLGEQTEIVCSTGNFIFLSNSPTVDLRNIPGEREYFALLIEFEYQDFDIFEHRPIHGSKYCVGEVGSSLERTLLQFVEWSLFAPPDMWHVRRREILQLLYSLGYDEVCSLVEKPTVSHKLNDILRANISDDINTEMLCSKLAMSESTLRRKLQSEGTSLQELKDQIKLGHGLHLLQTTVDSVGLIAEQCGYLSQSRFTDRFKQRFGLTPTELRKTHLHV